MQRWKKEEVMTNRQFTSDKERIFENIWNKMGTKSKDRLMQKVKARGMDATLEKCKEYWMGKIKPYKDPNTGDVMHLHVGEIKRRRKYGRTPRVLENQNRRKKRRPRY